MRTENLILGGLVLGIGVLALIKRDQAGALLGPGGLGIEEQALGLGWTLEDLLRIRDLGLPEEDLAERVEIWEDVQSPGRMGPHWGFGGASTALLPEAVAPYTGMIGSMKGRAWLPVEAGIVGGMGAPSLFRGLESEKWYWFRDYGPDWGSPRWYEWPAAYPKPIGMGALVM